MRTAAPINFTQTDTQIHQRQYSSPLQVKREAVVKIVTNEREARRQSLKR
jgi:hypothetical protein